MIICPRCQSQNQDGAPWCQYCGLPFTAYPPQSQYPPQQIPPQSQYPPQGYYPQQQYIAPEPGKNSFFDRIIKNPLLIGISVFALVMTVLFALSIMGVIGNKKYASIEEIPQKQVEEYCGKLILSSMIGSMGSLTSLSETATPIPTINFAVGEPVSIGDYSLTVSKSEILRDRPEGAFLLVYFNFANNSAETTSYGSKIENRAFQNGVQIQNFLAPYEYKDNLYTEVRPGASIEVITSFLLSDTSNPVELELTDSNWAVTEKFKCDLNLASL